ncbi:MAG: TrkA family potassium uptake protein [Oscillospiraceae bacterium]|nr:TrkA family potassium uptake protein [Oscillospiraceae bacterium]
MIVGGGNVGYYLAKALLEEKHHIMMIEADQSRCKQIATDFNSGVVEVTYGDGTDVDCLRDAGIFHVDALIAVTGHDQNNLVACQLAKDYFGVKRTIARVKNPKNIRVFEKLGVDSVISSTARIAAAIDQELDWTDVNELLKGKSLNVRIRKATVAPGSFFAGKRLAELGLPKGMILISVLHKDQVIIPSGDTLLEAGDMVIIMGSETDIEHVFWQCSSF